MATVNSNTVNLTLSSTYGCKWGDDGHNYLVNGSAPTTDTQYANFNNPVPAGGTITATRLVTTWSNTGGVNKAQVNGSALAAGTDTRNVSGFSHSYTWRCVQTCGAYQSQGNYTRTMSVSAYMSVDYTPATAPTVSGVTLAGSTSTRYAAAGESLTLAWSASNGTNNTISSYTIQRSDNGADYVNIKTGQTTKSYTVTAHPTVSKYYRYRVIAVAPYGNSAVATSPVVYTYSNPTPPSSVTVSPTACYTGENVAVSWDAGGAGTGVGISKYEVYCNDVKVGETTALSLTVAAPSTAGNAVYKVKTIGTVSGYNSALSSASATVVVENPRSTGTLNKSSVEMDGVSTIGITVTPSNAAYNHKVIWYTSLHTVTHILAVGVTTDTLDPVPLEWCTAYPNGTSGTANVKLETYNGTTKIGELIYPFTVIVPATVLPTVSALARAPVDGFTGLYLKGISKATLTATAAGAQGSTIPGSNYAISGGGSTGNMNPWTTPILTTVGTNAMSVTVTDTRGRTATRTENITVTDYVTPIISGTLGERCTSDGTADNDGTYVKVKATLTVTSLSGNNPIAVAKVEYRKRGITTWTLGTDTLVSDTYSVIGGGAIAVTDAYEIRILLQDTVGKSSDYTFIISPSSRLFDFRTDRASIGRIAGTTANKFILPDNWTTNINADQLDGNHASAFAAASHPHVKSDITDFAHSHGNITSDGKVGATADLPLFTGPNGIVVARTMAEAAQVYQYTTPNTLHNWDFRNPVNQRGVSGAITTGTYFFDRWIRNSGTVTVEDGYLTLDSGAEIEQRIEGLYLAGETVTVSVRVGSTIYNGTGVFPTAAGTSAVTLTDWGTATLGYSADYMFVRFTASGSQDVVAVKCELGTVSTLHLDPPMDHAVELAKCERFYEEGTFTKVGALDNYLLMPSQEFRTVKRCVPTIMIFPLFGTIAQNKVSRMISEATFDYNVTAYIPSSSEKGFVIGNPQDPVFASTRRHKGRYVASSEL